MENDPKSVGEQEQVEEMVEQLRDWPDMCQQYSERAADLLESQAQRIATLEAENERWKQVFADVDIDRQAIAAERDQLREALKCVVEQ